VAEARHHARAGRRAQRGRYVASLIWPGGVPRAANDNRTHLRLARVLPLAASTALLAVAVWLALF